MSRIAPTVSRWIASGETWKVRPSGPSIVATPSVVIKRYGV